MDIIKIHVSGDKQSWSVHKCRTSSSWLTSSSISTLVSPASSVLVWTLSLCVGIRGLAPCNQNGPHRYQPIVQVALNRSIEPSAQSRAVGTRHERFKSQCQHRFLPVQRQVLVLNTQHHRKKLISSQPLCCTHHPNCKVINMPTSDAI